MKLNSAGSEKYLLEALDRIVKNSSKYSALYVSISKLQPKNRHPDFIKILAKLFDSIVGSAMGTFFILSNGDFVIIGTKISHETIDATIENLKKGLPKDPIVHTTDTSLFVKIYDFPAELSELYAQVSNVAMAQKSTDNVIVKRALQNFEVDNVLAKMDNIDFAKLIKRQSVLKVKSANSFEVLSQEFFVAVKDFSAQYSPDLDLVANKWMFIYLTETLDRKALNALFQSQIKKLPKDISLNLNLSTIKSEEFSNWLQNFLPQGTTLTVEIQLMDIFNNMPLYFEMKERLQQAGHKVLLDALTLPALKMVNLASIAPDKVKIFWSPLMEFDTDNQDVKDLIQTMGAQNVILAKCSAPQALKWGFSYGLDVFQGPYMDELEVAIIKSRCPNAQICTNLSCLKRKRFISGQMRDECQHLDILETLLEG